MKKNKVIVRDFHRVAFLKSGMRSHTAIPPKKGKGAKYNRQKEKRRGWGE